jgi:hypothetical protein
MYSTQGIKGTEDSHAPPIQALHSMHATQCVSPAVYKRICTDHVSGIALEGDDQQQTTYDASSPEVLNYLFPCKGVDDPCPS